MNDDGSINSFMKIEFDQEPNYPYVPNTMIKYWCSGIEKIAIMLCMHSFIFGSKLTTT